MNRVYKILFAAFVVTCCAVSGSAQPKTVRGQEVSEAVAKIAELVGSNYVSEDAGRRIAAHLVREHSGGRFDSVKSWDEFAALSTKVLQTFSSDGHLYVGHDPKAVKDLLQTTIKKDAEAESGFFHGEEARARNYGFDEIRVLKGNIGYVRLSQINVSEKSLPTMFAAFAFVTNTRALVLDLRDNGGGGSEIGPVLESFFLPKNTALLEFKSRGGQTTVEKTVAWVTREKYDNPLYIVVNKKTASAAEAVAFALQARGRAFVVGQPSAGAANMNTWYAVNDEVYVSVSTGAPALPGTNKSWEGVGVRPDHVTAPGGELEFIVRKLGESR